MKMRPSPISARSPVDSHPSGSSARTVLASSRQYPFMTAGERTRSSPSGLSLTSMPCSGLPAAARQVVVRRRRGNDWGRLREAVALDQWHTESE